MNSIETDDILFQILNGNAEIKQAITGGIYTMGERPDDSQKEDIVVNNLFLNHTVPQTGTSNVNIHVPDMTVTIGGKQQKKGNRERIRTITGLVFQALKNANVEGLGIRVTNESIIKEPNIFEHYNNIRIDWNIQKTE
ncbi:MAG: hypothetical protein ACOYIG_10450 [Acetivibrionales bacterium]|jgi:hypothetical protein